MLATNWVVHKVVSYQCLVLCGRTTCAYKLEDPSVRIKKKLVGGEGSISLSPPVSKISSDAVGDCVKPTAFCAHAMTYSVP